MLIPVRLRLACLFLDDSRSIRCMIMMEDLIGRFYGQVGRHLAVFEICVAYRLQ